MCCSHKFVVWRPILETVNIIRWTPVDMLALSVKRSRIIPQGMAVICSKTFRSRFVQNMTHDPTQNMTLLRRSLLPIIWWILAYRLSLRKSLYGIENIDNIELFKWKTNTMSCWISQNSSLTTPKTDNIPPILLQSKREFLKRCLQSCEKWDQDWLITKRIKKCSLTQNKKIFNHKPFSISVMKF